MGETSTGAKERGYIGNIIHCNSLTLIDVDSVRADVVTDGAQTIVRKSTLLFIFADSDNYTH